MKTWKDIENLNTSYKFALIDSIRTMHPAMTNYTTFSYDSVGYLPKFTTCWVKASLNKFHRLEIIQSKFSDPARSFNLEISKKLTRKSPTI